jgi:hypothetical protein
MWAGPGYNWFSPHLLVTEHKNKELNKSHLLVKTFFQQENVSSKEL